MDSFSTMHKKLNKSLQSKEAVLTSSAQFDNLLQSRGVGNEVIGIINNHLIKDGCLSHIDKLVITVMADYGARVSECLSISHNDINNRFQIRLLGLKNSSDRVIQMTRSLDSVYFVKKNRIDIKELRNRWYFYRLFKKWGISYKYGDNTNNSVTHALRHEYVSNLQKDFGSLELSSKTVGHKSTKSTEYYVSKRK